MYYTNAKKGISRIFKGELLGICAAVLAGIGGAIIASIGVNDSPEAMNAGESGVLFGILAVVGILAVIAFLLKFMGVSRAGMDEPDFRKSLGFLAIGVIASLVESIFSGRMETLSEVAGLVSHVCDLLVTLFIIQGCINIADSIGNERVSDLGRSSFKMLILVYALVIILQVAVLFISNDTMAVVAGLITVAIAILSIVGYIIFLKMLNGARKML